MGPTEMSAQRRQQLTEANQLVAAAEARIANVRDLERLGGDATVPREGLAELEATLELMRRHRDMIERLVANPDGPKGD
jgi:hypothetical protein